MVNSSLWLPFDNVVGLFLLYKNIVYKVSSPTSPEFEYVATTLPTPPCTLLVWLWSLPGVPALLYETYNWGVDPSDWHNICRHMSSHSQADHLAYGGPPYPNLYTGGYPPPSFFARNLVLTSSPAAYPPPRKPPPPTMGEDDIQYIERPDMYDMDELNTQDHLVPYYYQQQSSLPPPPQKRRREPAKPRQPFVMKLWLMVNDPANAKYIHWTPDGRLFQVEHREEFTSEMLPKYFKHNKFSSFVRQLNMYGWHKVQDVTSGLLKEDKLDELLVFNNPNFIRNREDLLDNIVRNKGGQEGSVTANDPVLLDRVLNEVNQLRCNQLSLNEELTRLRKDNKELWKENYVARERNQQQAQTLDKILKFLATVYNKSNKLLDTSSGVSHPRLMLMDQEYPGEPSPDNSLIEEIIRNYDSLPGYSPPGVNLQQANHLFQQLMNQPVGPEPEAGAHNMMVPRPDYGYEELIPPYIPDDIKTKVDMQNGLLLQVQDWILKIADDGSAGNYDDFDVDQFLLPVDDQPSKRRKVQELN